MSALLTALLVGVVHAACDDAPLYIERAEQAVLSGRRQDAARALDDARVAWACGPAAESQVLARYWLAEGALVLADGDPVRARLSFSAAYREAPDFWPVDYGIQSFIQYQAAAQEWTGEAGIKLHPDPGARQCLLDGRPASFPTACTAGLHLVQIGQDPEAMELAAFVAVQPGETFLLLTELAPPGETRTDQPATASAPRPVGHRVRRHPSHPPALLISSGLSAALAGGAAWMAVRQTAVMESTTSEAELHQAFARQQTYAQATWALGGLSATGLGLYLVF